MPVDGYLKDGTGGGFKAAVDDKGSVSVISRGIPPKNAGSELRIFRDYFRDSNGGTDMKVSASSGSPVDFSIAAPSDADRYIDSISFLIVDAGAVLSNFGNISALSNGVEIFYEDPALGSVTIHEGLKSNFDFVRLCQGRPSFGSGSNSFRAPNVISNREAFIPVLDFSESFGVPWGIKLPSNSKLKITIRIKDNTTGVNNFDAIASGYDRIIS